MPKCGFFFYILGTDNECEWEIRTEFLMLISPAEGILELLSFVLFVNRARSEGKLILMNLKILRSLKISLMIIQTLCMFSNCIKIFSHMQ